jgi:omega-amidase
MSDLRVSLVQTPLFWHDPQANWAMLARKMAPLAGETDVVVLPEMFTTGFSMEAREWAEPMNGPTCEWMAQQAQKLDAVVTGSVIIGAEGRYWNRLLWIEPDGRVSYYDKRHLFRMAREHEYYDGGETRLIVEWRGWNVCPLVCYDLRFPVWSRNVGNEYDLLIYVANWPDRRALAWKSLLQARAIENLAYVAGVNRVGKDENGITYQGDSVLHVPTGEALWQGGNRETVQTLTLKRDELDAFRKRFPAHLDADRFKFE